MFILTFWSADMHNRYFIAVFVILFGAAVMFYLHLHGMLYNTTKTPVNNPKLAATTTLARADKSIQEKLKELKEQKASKQKTQQQKDTDEPSKAIYDADPVVDANVILKTQLICIQMLAKKQNLQKYLQRYKKNLDSRQIQHLSKVHDYCKKLSQNHPEYHLPDAKHYLQQKKAKTATSTWGKIINGEIDANELSDGEVENILAANDVNILIDAPQRLRKYYQKVIHWDLENILQNHQYDYTEQVLYYAHQLHLCNLGADCNPYATIMSTLCFINAESCGLSFQQFVTQILTPGQQADVQLALSYLQRKYQ